MAEASPNLPPSPATPGGLPEVRVEVKHGTARPSYLTLSDLGFLIGSVPGCDLRLPGANLPPVLCLLTRQEDGVFLRKLVPTQALFVNGRSVSSATLADGDRLTLGPVELVFQVQHSTPKPPGAGPALGLPRSEVEERVRALEARERQLEEQAQELDADRVIWHRRREEIERECRQQTEALQALRREAQERARPAPPPVEVDGLTREKQELQTVRQELTTIRQQLYDRYRERRDRLSGLQEAVDRAARKVQEQKRASDAEAARLASLRAELDDRAAALDGSVREIAAARERLEEERRLLEDGQRRREETLTARSAECDARHQQLQAEAQALEKVRAEYQADLVRLDRREALLEEQQKELEARAQEVEVRFERLQSESRDLEDQARRLDESHSRLAAESERVARESADVEPRRAELMQRAAELEGQQAMLATLRSRLERMREDVRRESQLLTEQQTRQEAAEFDLAQRLREAERLRAGLDAERQSWEQERRRYEERGSVLESAVARMREAQDKLAAEEQRLRQREQEFEARAAEQQEQVALVQARAAQLSELQQRLDADRNNLREREAVLSRAEQTRAVLQEQLQRRSEELAARQRALAEQAQRQGEAAAGYQASLAGVEERHAELERERQQAELRLATLAQEADARRAEIEAREQQLDALRQKMQLVGQAVAAERKALAAERARRGIEEEAIELAVAQRRAELEACRQEVLALQAQWPEQEQQGRAVVERLGQARDQLRESLAELHAYASQGRDDLDGLRHQVRTESEQVRQQEAALQRARDEHRLNVAAFRQQIIDWQGQVSEMRRALAQGEAELERRHAEVEERARQVGAVTERLAKQAEELDQQQRQVGERRAEVERHLADMREWYRKKLRELALSRTDAVPVPVTDLGTEEAERDVLALTGDIGPGDRQLGELLRSLELMDAETLGALLVEAHRQRRSLRQVLLAGNYLTLYQLALIEAGNLDGLVLGPTRVIDRLRTTSHEASYRVFDPRRGQEVVLRILAEADAQDAVRPDEFRQRFAAAATVQHPNVAATLEVLEVADRPAVLQEWLSGLPAPDWPPLTAVPGVWYRLLGQAALGLHTAHEAGLIHGHLHAGLVLMTTDGTLKLVGFGEPPWLGEPPPGDAEATPPDSVAEDVAADLAALGRIASGWAAVAARKGGKAKSLPESLQTILHRLSPEAGSEQYASAADLLDALDQAGADVPANAEAWDRLLRHVRDHAPAESALRRSA